MIYIILILIFSLSLNSCKKHVKECDEACIRAELGIPSEAERVIIFSQSSHLDWDWVKTFEDYYNTYVEMIFNDAFDLLITEPGYYYSIAEVGFLERHIKSHPDQQKGFADFAKSGRIKIVGGGVTSPDSLLPAGESFLRDYYYGFELLKNLFGEDYFKQHRPVAAWLPDDFGHSPTVPTMLREAGYRYVAFARLPGADTMKRFLGTEPPQSGSIAESLINSGKLDFVWQASDGSEVIAHYMYPNYGIGDTIDTGLDIPGFAGLDMNGTVTSEEYVNGKIKYFIDTIGKMSPTEYVFVPVGSDFQLPKKLLKFYCDRWNSSGYSETGVFAAVGSFEHYAKLIEFHKDRLDTIKIDPVPYWTGHYATKPELKNLHRRTEFKLRSAESLALLADGEQWTEEIDSVWKKLIPSNHHDFINGTSKDEIYSREQLPLLNDAESESERILNSIEQNVVKNIDTSGVGVPVVVFNNFGLLQSGPVEISGVSINVTNPEAIDSSGNRSPVQILSNQGGTATILFYATDVPSHGYKVYHIVEGQPAPNNFVISSLSGGSFGVNNGLIDLIVNKDGIISMKYKGTELLASTGIANGINFYRDDGGLYRLGAEIQGCKYNLTDFPDDASQLTVEENGPVRARLKIVNNKAGVEFNREIEIVSGENTVRMKTTGIAPVGYTVTARFDIDGAFQNAEMAVPYGVAIRSLSGPWNKLFHPAHEFFAPLLSDGSAKIAFSSKGPLAWNAETNGMVEYILFRNSNSSCELYGPNGTDNASHTIEYAMYLTDPGNSLTDMALPGYKFNNPLRVVLTDAHSGELPSSFSLFSTDNPGAWIHVVKKTGGKVFIRIFRLNPDLKEVKVIAKVPFTHAFLSDMILTESQELEINDDGSLNVPLMFSLNTVLLK